jgi:hypothetical protein
VSFETNGAAPYEGEWTMEQLSDEGSHWRWSAQLGDAQLIQIGADDRIYSTNPSEPVPLRVQLVRSVRLRPVVHNAGVFEIRARDVEHDGKQMTCLLLSHALPPNPAPRSWARRSHRSGYGPLAGVVGGARDLCHLCLCRRH